MASPIPSYPLVNGARMSWVSISTNIVTPSGNFQFSGIKEISYKNVLEPGDVMGIGPQKLGRTLGQLKPEASITLYFEEYNALISAIGTGYLAIPFDITVNFSEYNNPTIVTDVIRGARIKSGDKSFADGTDALIVKCDLNVMSVTENGISPLPAVTSGI